MRCPILSIERFHSIPACASALSAHCVGSSACHKSLHRFLATERGVVKYPPYALNRTRPVFDSRQELLEYEEALAAAAELDGHLQVLTDIEM